MIQVQKSVKDPSVLEAIYEGKHNHRCPSRAKLTDVSSHGMNLGSNPVLAYCSSSKPTLPLDHNKHSSCCEAEQASHGIESSEFQRIFVKQMVSSLTKDCNFRAALSEAFLERINQLVAEELRK